MNKKLLLLTLGFLPLSGMELSEPVTIPTAQATDTSMVTFQLQDGTLEIEGNLAHLSQTIKNLIKDVGTDNPIPLPNITLSTWKLIHAQLKRVYNIQDEPENKHAKEALIADINNLDSRAFVDLLNAANYLDITLLYNLMVEYGDLQELTKEYFSQLSPDSARDLIISDLRHKLPPLNGKQIAICKGHTRDVNSVCVARDKIISGSLDNTIRVWDIQTGKQTAICKGHTDTVKSVCVTGDKTISGSCDKTIRVWNIQTGEQTAICKGHTHGVGSVCVAGNKIISGSYDNTIRVWNIQTGEQTAICNGHTDNVYSVCVAGNKIISGSFDNTIRVWNISLLNRLQSMNRKQTDAIYTYLKTAQGNNAKDHWEEIENILNASDEEEAINNLNEPE